MAFGYQRWSRRRLEELSRAGELIPTSRGEVELSRSGEGTPVLFTHGGPGGHDQAFVLSDLRDHGFEILCPSRPGYLRTPLAAGKTFAEQADTFAALLDEVGIERVAAIGASAGGPPAIEFAARHPDRTSALVLMSAVSGRYAPAIPAWARAVFLTGWGTYLQLSLFRRFPQFVVRQLVEQESTWDRSRCRQEAKAIVADAVRLRFVEELLGNMTPYEARREGLENDLVELASAEPRPLGAIRCPTLVVHGTADGDVDFRHAEDASTAIDGAQLLRLDDGWHLPPLGEGWEKICRRIADFLRDTWK